MPDVKDSSQWTQGLHKKLAIAISKLPVEPGIDHPEEATILKVLKDHRDDAPAFFTSIVTSQEPWRGDLLRLLARVPAEYRGKWSTKIAKTALDDTCADVREAAISALETWGGLESKRLLASHSDSEDWLMDYAHRVSKELE